MRWIAGAAVGLALSGLVAACGDDSVEIGKVERALATLVQEASSMEVAASCPSKVDAQTGTRFTCTVTAAGREYEVRGEVADAAAEGRPWEFDEDDLHVGPATLTCAQLREDGAWRSAAEQLVAREGVTIAADDAGEQQLQSIGKLFTDECRAAAAGSLPYPVVASQVASP